MKSSTMIDGRTIASILDDGDFPIRSPLANGRCKAQFNAESVG